MAEPPALTLLSYEAGQSKVLIVERQLVDQDEFLLEIKGAVAACLGVDEGTYDKHHRELEFLVGDWVSPHIHHHT
jgi:hypothetical protein